MDRRGLIFGLIAYGLWGVLPLYWKVIRHVPAQEILVHRIVWSFIFLSLLLSLRRQWDWLRGVAQQRSTIRILIAAALLLSVNWFIYIWAVNAGFVVETSLGYFINPLVNVLLGTLYLRERLRPGQWAAVSLAAAGVLYLTISYGSLPWIALSLAFSFGIYGLLKKKVNLGAAESLTAEMSVLLIPAIGYLVYLEFSRVAVFSSSGATTVLFMIGTGIVTATPLVFFAAAARRVPLSMLGLLQYIAPTMQFLIGITAFQEPFTLQRLVGFAIIWAALAVYSLEGAWQRRIQTAALG